MPHKVSGFLSQDENFFQFEDEAVRHDAEMEMRAYCTRESIDAEKLIHHIEALADPIREYVHASEKIRDREAEKGGEGIAFNSETLVHPANEG